MLAKSWIQPSHSQYNHPILFVPKKCGELRMCIDFRALSANTINSALHDCVKWQHASETLRVSLADKSVVLSTKIAVLSVQIGEHVRQEIEFHVVPRLNHPLILGLQWLRIANPTIDWSMLNITLDGHTAPVVTGTINTRSKHSAMLCTAKQM